VKLKLINWLEEQIIHRVADNAKMSRLELTRFHDAPFEFATKSVVDYRLRIGARVKCADKPGGMQLGRDRVFKLLCREIYKDLIEETHLVAEWAYQEGYDRDMTDKLERLIKLMRGEDVQDGSFRRSE
jgi:hypothetical protein